MLGTALFELVQAKRDFCLPVRFVGLAPVRESRRGGRFTDQSVGHELVSDIFVDAGTITFGWTRRGGVGSNTFPVRRVEFRQIN